jgi:hypothetical protein
MTHTAIRLEEAVPLGYAVCARLASDHGVRLLAIKGPVLAEQGLRTKKTSADIDVLVDPAGVDAFCAALEAIGWHDGGYYATPRILPRHSVTHRHPLWPSEIDVHHWFPGFLADPSVVFDVLWDRSTSVELAHVAVKAPDPVAHVALEALHYLRDGATLWGRAELEALESRIAVLWSGQERRELAELAQETGAADTLAPFLDAIGAPRAVPSRETVVPLRDWQMRAGAAHGEVLPWLVNLRRTSWHRRPAAVARAAWPVEQQMRSADPSLGDSWGDLMRARWLRLKRGLRILPRAYRELRRLTQDD